MEPKKTTFALFFGNRGIFPSALIEDARQELADAVRAQGHNVLMLDPSLTRCGAVETNREGEIYANFLRANRGEFGGVILCLPNFGDESGAVAALKDAGVPILIQAYPDEFGKMSPAQRRDAFCGKLSVMDVFGQYGVKFTALKPHVISPLSRDFPAYIDTFDRVCRVVNGVKGMVVGAIGARTTPFKTVRTDEVTLQRHGITVETLDLSDIFLRMEDLEEESAAYRASEEKLKAYTSFKGVPPQAFDRLIRLGAVLDQVIEEYQMDAIAIRCWTELQRKMGVSPCVLLGELNERYISAACEVDTGNAVIMHALNLASGRPAALLDWNNNYGTDEDRCILFHCGPVPRSLMANGGQVVDNPMLAVTLGEGCGFGCHIGRIKPTEFTFSSLLTDAGKIKVYLGEGRFTADSIPPEYFGCAGVAEVNDLQNVLLHIGRHGFRHHVSLTPGTVQFPLQEALENYLGFEVSLPQKFFQPLDRVVTI